LEPELNRGDVVRVEMEIKSNNTETGSLLVAAHLSALP
jgi:hypothetical protein